MANLLAPTLFKNSGTTKLCVAADGCLYTATCIKANDTICANTCLQGFRVGSTQYVCAGTFVESPIVCATSCVKLGDAVNLSQLNNTGTRLKICGTGDNYAYFGPNNDDSWTYIVSMNNSAGMYFHTNQGNFQFDTGSLGSYTDAEVDVGYASHRFRCGYFSDKITLPIVNATSCVCTSRFQATGCLDAPRIKAITGSNQINIGQWDGSRHRIEGDAWGPLFITSYQGGIFFGISGSCHLALTAACLCSANIICANTSVKAPIFCGTTCGDVLLGSYVGSVKWPHCTAQSGSRTFAWSSNQGVWGNLVLAMSDANDATTECEMIDIRNNLITTCKTLCAATCIKSPILCAITVCAHSTSAVIRTDGPLLLTSLANTNPYNKMTIGGGSDVGGYSRAVSIWASHCATWESWVGTNLIRCNCCYYKATDNPSSNWGNIAGIMFRGAAGAGDEGIFFVTDAPASTNTNVCIGTSLTSRTRMTIANNGHVRACVMLCSPEVCTTTRFSGNCLYIDGGTQNGGQDATAYITATNNNDWGLIVNKNNGSSSEYGIETRMGGAAVFAYRASFGGDTRFSVGHNCLCHKVQVTSPILCATNCIQIGSSCRPALTNFTGGLSVQRVGANSGDSQVGIQGKDESGDWRFTLYGTADNYGFLDASWAGWDIKKTVNGSMCIWTGSSGFFCNMEGAVFAATCLSAPTVCATNYVKVGAGSGVPSVCFFGAGSQVASIRHNSSTARLSIHDDGGNERFLVHTAAGSIQGVTCACNCLKSPVLCATNCVTTSKLRATGITGTADPVLCIQNGSGSHSGPAIRICSANSGNTICTTGTAGSGCFHVSSSYNADPTVCTTGLIRGCVFCATNKVRVGNVDFSNPWDTRLKLCGSGDNYMVIGPANDNGWGYIESTNNSHGIYFGTNQGGFSFDTGHLKSYTDGEVDVGVSGGRFRCACFSHTVTAYCHYSTHCATSPVFCGTTCLQAPYVCATYSLATHQTNNNCLPASVIRNNAAVSGSYGAEVMWSRKWLLHVTTAGDVTQNDANSKIVRLQLPASYADANGTSGTIKISYFQGHAGGVMSFEYKFGQYYAGGTTNYSTWDFGTFKVQKTGQLYKEYSYLSTAKAAYIKNNLKFYRHLPASGTFDGQSNGLVIKIPNSGTSRLVDISVEVEATGRSGSEDYIKFQDLGTWTANAPSGLTEITQTEFWSGINSDNVICTSSNVCSTCAFEGPVVHAGGSRLGSSNLFCGATCIHVDGDSKLRFDNAGTSAIMMKADANHELYIASNNAAVGNVRFPAAGGLDATSGCIKGPIVCATASVKTPYLCQEAAVPYLQVQSGCHDSGFGGMQLRNCNGSTKGYVYWGSTNDFGLLHCDGGWAVKLNGNTSVYLYHNNSLKLQTTASGATVTGELCASGGVCAASVTASSYMNSGKFCSGSTYMCNTCLYVAGAATVTGTIYTGGLICGACICGTNRVSGTHYGDGSNLTGISAGTDTCENLTCLGLYLGCCAGKYQGHATNGAFCVSPGAGNVVVGPKAFYGNIYEQNAPNKGDYFCGSQKNTIVGALALYHGTRSGENVVMGYCALYCTRSWGNGEYGGNSGPEVYGSVVIGMGALAGANSHCCGRPDVVGDNVYIGKSAGFYSGPSICRNVVIGRGAAYGYDGNNCMSIKCNTIIGAYTAGNSIKFFCNNIIIGHDVDAPNQCCCNHIVIGNSNNGGSGGTGKMCSCAFTFSGSVSKSSGSFLIAHPDPDKTPTKDLWHSFVESPNEGDNIYRYSLDVTGCRGVITLPDYYSHLNKNDQVWVSPVGHFGAAYGAVTEDQKCAVVCANTDGCYNLLVIGTRKDPAAENAWNGAERNLHGMSPFVQEVNIEDEDESSETYGERLCIEYTRNMSEYNNAYD